jgi:nucleotide-binding universal stress UspA family protein
MYSKVLVPLDGSEVAECALAEVGKLMEGGMVREIVLLSVIVIPTLALGEGFDYPRFRKSHFDNSQRYLERIRSGIAREGLTVATEILEGNAAQMIVQYAGTHAVDLIVIATHGYSGMKKLMFGSVALQVLHESDVPVLLIRPKFSKA